jgi:DNA polymerase-3 subunit alpha
MLFIKGSMKPRFGSDTQLEFKVTSVTLLAEVKEKLIKKVTFILPLQMVQNGFAKEFKGLLEKHKGSANVSLKLVDADQMIEVNTLSSKSKVVLDNELIAELERKGITYKLN